MSSTTTLTTTLKLDTIQTSFGLARKGYVKAPSDSIFRFGLALKGYVKAPSDSIFRFANKAEIEGPIQGLSDELIEGILFFTDKNDQVSTRLVSRRWNILTLNAKFPIKQDLNQFFRLLADNRR